MECVDPVQDAQYMVLRGYKCSRRFPNFLKINDFGLVSMRDTPNRRTCILENGSLRNVSFTCESSINFWNFT